jgi:uncharacterized protein (TIGR02145 family)
MKLFTFTKSGRTLLFAAAVAAAGLPGCMMVADDKDDAGGNTAAGNSHIHTWGDWVVTTPATCDARGVETRTCAQNANHRETRAIARLTGAACNTGGGNGGGDSYEFVTIGGQKWMTKNLNIQTADSWCYGEGGQIVVGGTADNYELRTLSPSEVQANCNKYGRLYTREAAKKACPSGWHLPTFDEWLEAANAVRALGGYLVDDLDLGLSLQPGGIRYSNIRDANNVLYRSVFGLVGEQGYWWMATPIPYDYDDIGIINYLRLNNKGSYNIYNEEAGINENSVALSVRCIMDE